MEKKVCIKCKEEKELTELIKGSYECKLCRKKYRKEYRENNKERLKEYHKNYYQSNIESIREYKEKYIQEYRENNKDKIKEQRKIYRQNNIDRITEYKQIYRENNKERITEYYEKNKEIRKEYLYKYLKLRRQSDTLFKLTTNIRNIIVKSLKNKGYIKESKTHLILGITYEEFKLQIESQWEEWMNWGNYGKYNGEENYGWDLDHIIPLSSGKCEEDIIKLNHYSNIQPLCSYINRNVKRDKII